MKILIAEDEKSYLIFIEQYLFGEGFDVKSVELGNEVVKLAREFQPDVMLLDKYLPDLNAPAILKQIKEDPLLNTIPILIMSGDSATDSILQSYDLGADDYLTKPFFPSILVRKIKAVCRRSSTAKNVDDRTVAFKNVININLNDNAVSVRGQSLLLTSTEYKILVELVVSYPQLFSRKEFEKVVFDKRQTTKKCLDVHMFNLRKKLSNFKVKITTVRGTGYKLSSEN